MDHFQSLGKDRERCLVHADSSSNFQVYVKSIETQSENIHHSLYFISPIFVTCHASYSKPEVVQLSLNFSPDINSKSQHVYSAEYALLLFAAQDSLFLWILAMYISAVGSVLQIVCAFGFDIAGCVSCGCNIASSACIALENKYVMYKLCFFLYIKRTKESIMFLYRRRLRFFGYGISKTLVLLLQSDTEWHTQIQQCSTCVVVFSIGGFRQGLRCFTSPKKQRRQFNSIQGPSKHPKSPGLGSLSPDIKEHKLIPSLYTVPLKPTSYYVGVQSVSFGI